jgi:hypothetical protein
MLDYPVRPLPFDSPQMFHYGEGELRLQPGYLVSECELLRLTNMKIELKRLKLDLAAMTRLRSREFELWRTAELKYQNRIDELAAGWWVQNKLYVGVAIGVAAMAVTTWTAAHLVR